MPFGLRNAAQSFQRFVDNIFRDLPFVFVYIDNNLAASANEDEHRRHPEIILQRLAANGITNNATMCQFAVESLDFLGHHINASGIQPMAAKVVDIREFPPPPPPTALTTSAAKVSWHGHVLSPFSASLCSHLGTITRSCSCIQCTQSWANLTWTDACTHVSLLLTPSRQCLQTQQYSYTLLQAHTPLLLLIPPLPPLVECSDSIKMGNGAFWRSSPGTCLLRNGSTTRSGASCLQSIPPSSTSGIEGRQFTVLTDHKPVCYFLATSSSWHSPHEIRHLAFILEFTTDIQHISGVDNPVADALSRVEALTVPEHDLNLHQLAVDQQDDPQLQHLRLSPTCSLQWWEVSLPSARQRLVCDFSTGTPRPYLPPAYRRAVFNSLHNTTHPGILASRHLVAFKYVWEKMNLDVTACSWTRSCVSYQRSKVHRHTAQTPAHFLPPEPTKSMWTWEKRESGGRK